MNVLAGQPFRHMATLAGADPRCAESLSAPAAPIPVAVVVASSGSAHGEREDLSGPVAAATLHAAGYDVIDVRVVPDGEGSVGEALRAALRTGARLVVTSGGTGVGPRDETPEATRTVLHRELPGVAEALRRQGEQHVPTAVLSRGLAGVTTGGAVVVNLPGSPGAVEQGLRVLLPLVPHLLDQTRGGDHR